MKAAQAALLPAVLAVLASGCGTVLNFASGDPDVYGGVQRDIQVVFTPDSVAFTPNTVPSSDAMAGVVVVALVAADIGLSAICDTLTLPLTIYLRQNEKTPNVSDLAPPKQAETAPAASEEGVRIPYTCQACGRTHLVDPRARQPAGPPKEEEP